MSSHSNRRVIATVVPPGHTFTIDSRYQPGKLLGKGSFGVVCTAFDTINQTTVAIKRIRPFANDEWDARHTLREIRLMKLLGRHPNIITLYELSIFEEKSELYMVMELMDCDLHRIIQSKQPLNDMHYKCFAKQMLEGIRAMHEIGVFHRDLKPGNILVSKDCQLRITDFGLARFIDKITLSGNNRQNPLTEYVVTRWYRCPELLLSPNLPYSAAVDIWSIGCIIGELIKRKPLFPGKSHANQVQLVLEVRGYSEPSCFGFELTQEATSFLDRKCRYSGKALSSFIPQATPEALELLETLLDLNPRRRPSAARALQFSYLHDAQVLCDYGANVMPRKIDEKYFDFERIEYSLAALQSMVREEVAKPCDDSVFFPIDHQAEDERRQFVSKASTRSLHRDDVHSSENDETVAAAGAGVGAGAGAAAYPLPHQKISSSSSQKNLATPSRNTTNSSDSNQANPMGTSAAGGAAAGAGAEGGTKMSRSKSAPPSPSPQKMEMIAKQEKKHKRRFFLQGLNKSSHEQQQQQHQGSSSFEHVSGGHSSSRSELTPSHEELTSRRDIIAPAGVIRTGVHQLALGAMRSASNKYFPNHEQQQQQQTPQSSAAAAASAAASAAYLTSASEKYQRATPNLTHQFQNLSVSYGGSGNSNQDPGNSSSSSSMIPSRKLASAPPVTRLPALPIKKSTFGAR